MTHEQRDLIKQAVQEAIRDEVVDHIHKGQDVVVWENNQVVHLSPEEAQKRLDEVEG